MKYLMIALLSLPLTACFVFSGEESESKFGKDVEIVDSEMEKLGCGEAFCKIGWKVELKNTSPDTPYLVYVTCDFLDDRARLIDFDMTSVRIHEGSTKTVRDAALPWKSAYEVTEDFVCTTDEFNFSEE